MAEWVGGYTRRSRDEQKDAHLLDNHVSLIERTARADGVDLPAERIFMEVGSGESISGRPVFRRLLEEWERLPRDCGGVVYVTEMSRLTRNFSDDAPRILRALERAGIVIRTPGRRYDLRRTDDDFMFKIEGVMADREQSEIKRRLAAGQREARLKGRLPNGIAPFGYRYQPVGKTLEPDPDRFPILQRCCRLAVTVPVWRLAEIEQVPENCLLRALRNPTICGYPARHYGPRDPEQPSRKTYIPIPRDQWLWPEQQNLTYPHACTREEWEILQAALDARRDSRARIHTGEGWCRDVLQFAGTPGKVRLGSYAVTRRAGGNIMCLTYERSFPVGGTRIFVPRAIVHAAVHTALIERMTHPVVVSWLEELHSMKATDAPAPVTKERAALSQSLADCRRRYQEAVDAEMDADDPNWRQALATRRNRLQDRLTRLQGELQSLEARADRERLSRLLQAPLAVTPEQFERAWAAYDGLQRRAVVNACLSLVEVTIQPTRAPAPHRREVTRLLWQPWVPSPSY